MYKTIILININKYNLIFITKFCQNFLLIDIYILVIIVNNI
jgi:hypothetical protein